MELVHGRRKQEFLFPKAMRREARHYIQRRVLKSKGIQMVIHSTNESHALGTPYCTRFIAINSKVCVWGGYWDET